MIRHLRSAAFVVVFMIGAVSAGYAQDSRPQTPLKVQIVIARYQGDKKVSSVPYTLSVNAGGASRSSIRMGADVPVGTYNNTNKDGVSRSGVEYRTVGTNIDCTANILTEGRFSVAINVEDSSVYPNGQGPGAPNTTSSLPVDLNRPPSFRHFSASENVILRDGQSSEFTIATDKFTGEVVKADVTLTVVK